MDKYLHLELLCQIEHMTKYSWLGYTILVIEYADGHRTTFPWQIFGQGCFTTLDELDAKLEELWQKHLSKSEVEA